MIEASKLAFALAVVGGLAVATTGELLAAPVPSNVAAIKQAVPAAGTDVRCGEFLGACGPSYGGYYWGYPTYSYRDYPAYSYRGYAYRGYPYSDYWSY